MFNNFATIMYSNIDLDIFLKILPATFPILLTQVSSWNYIVVVTKAQEIAIKQENRLAEGSVQAFAKKKFGLSNTATEAVLFNK